MPYTLEQISEAIRRADAAGDAESVKRLAPIYRQLQAQPSPAQNQAPADQMQAAPTPPPAAPQPAAPPPQPQQPASVADGPSWWQNALNNVTAGLASFNDTVSFGLLPAAMQGVQNFLSPGSGDAYRQHTEQIMAANPAGTIAGMVASIPATVAATGGIGSGLAAATAASKIPSVVRAGELVGKAATGGGMPGAIVRNALLGAAAGGTQAATHGEDMATGALIGGVIGPVAGAAGRLLTSPAATTAAGAALGAGTAVATGDDPLAGAAAGAVAGYALGRGAKWFTDSGLPAASARAWRYLANKLHETPDDFGAYMARKQAETGQVPSIAQIVSDHDAGVIKQFGKNYPHAGQELNAGARDAATVAGAVSARTSLPNAPTFLRSVAPADATEAALLNARDSAMDAAMAPIRQQQVTLPQDIIDDVNRTLSGRALRGIKERLSLGTATVDDVDVIRQRLAKMNATNYNPDIAQLADDLEAVAAPPGSDYRKALDQFAAASRYITGFTKGRSGTAVGDITDAAGRATMRQPEGQAGHAVGLSMRKGEEQARASAPGGLRPQAEDVAANANLAMSATTAGIAPISAGRALGRGIIQLLSHTNFSPAVQRELGAALSSRDPATIQRALGYLRRAKVSESRIRAIEAAVAADVPSRVVGDMTAPQREIPQITVNYGEPR